MKSGVILFLIVMMMSCSTADSFLENEEDTSYNETLDQENKRNNVWIYTQMLRHYYWNENIPDSTKLDFLIEPGDFFTSLKSKEDRFSWCEANPNYKKRGINIGSTFSFDSVYIINDRKIGYAIYDQFHSNAAVQELAIKMKNTKINDLIIDLRYNPGGYVATAVDLASYIVPYKYLGRLFQEQRFNSILTREKMEKRRDNGRDSVYFYSTDWYRKWGLNLSQLIILTTTATASASESLIIGLRPYMKVITIGTTTCGKDVGSYTIADNNYKYQLQPITFKYYNANNESTPTTGIVPDIYVEDDLDHQRGDTNEALLKAAIEYLTGEIQIGAVKDRSVSQPKMKEVGRSSIEIKNNL